MDDNRPQVFTEQCLTCVFRPGNQMKLRKGRLKELIQDNVRNGAALVCHETLPYGPHPEIGETYCRGFYDRVSTRSNFIRIMQRLGGFKEIAPPSAEKPEEATQS